MSFIVHLKYAISHLQDNSHPVKIVTRWPRDPSVGRYSHISISEGRIENWKNGKYPVHWDRVNWDRHTCPSVGRRRVLYIDYQSISTWKLTERPKQFLKILNLRRSSFDNEGSFRDRQSSSPPTIWECVASGLLLVKHLEGWRGAHRGGLRRDPRSSECL